VGFFVTEHAGMALWHPFAVWAAYWHLLSCCKHILQSSWTVI